VSILFFPIPRPVASSGHKLQRLASLKIVARFTKIRLHVRHVRRWCLCCCDPAAPRVPGFWCCRTFGASCGFPRAPRPILRVIGSYDIANVCPCMISVNLLRWGTPFQLPFGSLLYGCIVTLEHAMPVLRGSLVRHCFLACALVRFVYV
jgi:hypothetical protein